MNVWSEWVIVCRTRSKDRSWLRTANDQAGNEMTKGNLELRNPVEEPIAFDSETCSSMGFLKQFSIDQVDLIRRAVDALTGLQSADADIYRTGSCTSIRTSLKLTCVC